MFSGHRLPRLPPKQLLPAAASAAATATLVAERLVMLDAYLKQMLAVPDVYVGGCTQMLTFLGAYQGMQTSWSAQPNWLRLGLANPNPNPNPDPNPDQVRTAELARVVHRRRRRRRR